MKHKNANRKIYTNKKKEKIQEEKPLHEKPYFPGPGISRKTQKYQVNITFISTFWIKNYCISRHRKAQNKNFSVISKYLISITAFLITEKLKTRTFQLPVNIIFP